MEATELTRDLGIADRITRSKGRSSRNRMANSRVTQDEQKELERAARAEGKALSEWAREVLLREARSAKHDAMFTELVSMRMLLNNVLKVVATGQKITGENYQEIQAGVRAEKKRVALEIMQQYTAPAGEEH